MVVREKVADEDANAQALDNDGAVEKEDEQLLERAEAEDGPESSIVAGRVSVQQVDVAARLHFWHRL